MEFVKSEELKILLGTDRQGVSGVMSLARELNVNIRAVNLTASGSGFDLRIITSNNGLFRERIADFYPVESKTVIVAQLDDRVGVLAELVEALQGEDIVLEYLYGTTVNSRDSSIVVFSSVNNDRALDILSGF